MAVVFFFLTGPPKSGLSTIKCKVAVQTCMYHSRDDINRDFGYPRMNGGSGGGAFLSVSEDILCGFSNKVLISDGVQN